MEIIRGKLKSAQKVVVYGPEGIGKSTFAAQFPDPLFIDTEGSTKEMDIARLKKPSSWTMLLEQIREVKANPTKCKSLVIDTIDWAEQMCVEAICSKYGKSGIEDFGYGNGYVYAKEEFGRFLNLLEEVIEVGINVVLTAHAQIRKFEQPDELGAYDRYELKLGKKTSSQTSPLVKEWADMVLFANYKTLSVATDKDGKKFKAQGGKRVMYTSHHACWDAKNRHGLKEQLDFSFSEIAHIFKDIERTEPVTATTPKPEVRIASTNMYFYHPESDCTLTVMKGQELPNDPSLEEIDKTRYDEIMKSKAPKPIQEEPPEKEVELKDITAEQMELDMKGMNPPESNIPQALKDLMTANGVDEWDIQAVVAKKGYYPENTPIENYAPDFIAGVLVAAWPQVHGMIKEMKANQKIPFD